MKVWIVRYWMPPKRFLTYALCAASQEAAIKLAWDEVLWPMHRDGWKPVQHPGSEYWTDQPLPSSPRSR